MTARSDINALILDYLTMEGYPKAAAKFSKEANLQPQQKDSLIVARQEIKQAILEGRIDAAITSLNDLDPEVRVFASPPRCYDEKKSFMHHSEPSGFDEKHHHYSEHPFICHPLFQSC